MRRFQVTEKATNRALPGMCHFTARVRYSPGCGGHGFPARCCGFVFILPSFLMNKLPVALIRAWGSVHVLCFGRSILIFSVILMYEEKAIVLIQSFDIDVLLLWTALSALCFASTFSPLLLCCPVFKLGFGVRFVAYSTGSVHLLTCSFVFIQLFHAFCLWTK